MADQERHKRFPPAVENWELERIAEFAKKIEPREPEELAAELMRRLAVLKAKPPCDIQDWDAYLWRFLRNKANNWFRDRRTRQKPIISLDQARTPESNETFAESIPVPLSEDSPLAFAQVWAQLGPKLQRFVVVWGALEGDQTAIGIRLRIHRNTVRLWKKKVRQIFIKHGFRL